MDTTYLQERITKTRAIIEAYEGAILALSAGGIESYKLDTGQSIQQVTKMNLSELNMALDALYARLCAFETRLTGSGTITLKPSW